jgi:vancomycin resistance protein VanJ
MLRVAEVLSKLDADLVGVSEYEPGPSAQLYDQVADRYPHHAFFPGRTDVGLLSRYPILRSQLIDPAELRSPLLRAVVDVQGVPVVVYVVHIASPEFSRLPFGYDDSQRDREMALVRDLLVRETGPLLVLCDCNLSDQSDAYRAWDRFLTDSFREAGRGMGFTFPGERRFVPALVRIDYIWHSDHFAAREVYPLKGSGTSDHRPVVATLSLK